MAVVLNDILRVAARMHHALHGDLVNVYHLRVEDIASMDDSIALDACAEWIETLYTTVVSHMAQAWTFEDINVFDVTQDRPLGSAAWPTLVDGGDEYNDTQPPQVAALVRATTGYSRNWARKFLGGFSEARNTAQGFLDSTLVTALGNFALAWITPLVEAEAYTLQPVVWHKGASLWRPLVEGVVRNVWSTVRTRRTGRGA